MNSPILGILLLVFGIVLGVLVGAFLPILTLVFGIILGFMFGLDYSFPDISWDTTVYDWIKIVKKRRQRWLKVKK